VSEGAIGVTNPSCFTAGLATCPAMGILRSLKQQTAPPSKEKLKLVLGFTNFKCNQPENKSLERIYK
jgi:hypothetical protein